MRYSTFRYNAETCQYERVRVTAKGVLWYALGLVVTGSCLLVGILILHDWLINTARENQLRSENKALRKHHAVLASQLNELQPVLTSLEERDKVLHQKFFGSQMTLPAENENRTSKQEVLLADPATFRKHISSLEQTSDELMTRASFNNVRFASALKDGKDDVRTLYALPTLQPVPSWQPDRLISGFGMRVNPFHKGLYKHTGVDIAMPRGTPVVATAAGRVVQLKRSDLQAGYGNYVEIDHGNGVITRYAHLEEVNVRFGGKVARGETIGTIGSSGGSVAPHLHYEIIRDGENVDPVYYMVERLSPAEHYLLTITSHQQNQSLD